MKKAQQEAERRLKGQLENLLNQLKQETTEAKKSLDSVDPPPLGREDLVFGKERTEQLLKALEQADLAEAKAFADDALDRVRQLEFGIEDRMRGRFGTQSKQLEESAPKVDSRW